jgi:hypothetical protein
MDPGRAWGGRVKNNAFLNILTEAGEGRFVAGLIFVFPPRVPRRAMG